MSDDLPSLAERCLEAAKAAGAEAADVLVARGDGISMEIRQGALEQAERSEGVDLGLRVLIGGQQACVSVSDTRPDAIRQMAERAVAMAREAPEDPHAGLASSDALVTAWDAAVLDLEESAPAPDPAALAEAARIAEAAALAVDGVTQVSSAGADYRRSEVWLMASNGFSGGYGRTSHTLACVAISGDGLGMEREYCVEGRAHAADMPSPEEVGHLAARRAVARQGAVQPKTGAVPVLFDERVSSSLVGHILSAVNGASVARGTSWLKDGMGEPVLPDTMSVLEEPNRPRVSSSRPFDGEGLPPASAPIVEAGILKRWILDLASARKMGLESTGNAARGIGAPPSPSVGNIRLAGPETPLSEMMAEIGEGFLVTSMMGSSINPNTGDYSRGASGFWIRGGEVAEPVNECTIAGRLPEMLLTLRMADDARPHLSRVVPSLLVEGLTVAGA